MRHTIEHARVTIYRVSQSGPEYRVIQEMCDPGNKYREDDEIVSTHDTRQAAVTECRRLDDAEGNVWEFGHADVFIGGVYGCKLGNSYKCVLFDPEKNKTQIHRQRCISCVFWQDQKCSECGQDIGAEDINTMRCKLVFCKAEDRADGKNVCFRKE